MRSGTKMTLCANHEMRALPVSSDEPAEESSPSTFIVLAWWGSRHGTKQKSVIVGSLAHNEFLSR